MAVSCYGDRLDSAKEQAEAFGRQQISFAVEQVKSAEAPAEFDADEAYRMALEEEVPESEVRDYLEDEKVLRNTRENKLLDPEEFFLKRSEAITEDPMTVINHIVQEEGVEYAIKTCKKSGEPYPLVATRTLEVAVTNIPEVISEKKVCLGHRFEQKFRHDRSAKRVYNKYKKKLSTDSELSWYGVQLANKTVTADWRHYNDRESCDLFEIRTTLVQEGVTGEEDRWVWGGLDAEQAASPSCNLVSQECVEGEATKTINGLDIHRKCWKEKLVFFVTTEKVDDCSFLKAKNCTLLSQRCLDEREGVCLLWEKIFKCLSKITQLISPSSSEDAIYGMDGSWQPDYEENTSFADASTKLSVFAEMKQELEKSGMDASDVALFSGKVTKCSKNVLDGLFYDCCFSMRGLATQMQLAKCSVEEIGLSEKREHGMCHYVGSYAKTTLGVETSKKYSYCCFSSKLARVLQESAREQLGIKWGKAKKPNCRGLSHEEISRLDFSKLDLSELFEDQFAQVPVDLDERLGAFQTRLEDVKKRMVADGEMVQ